MRSFLAGIWWGVVAGLVACAAPTPALAPARATPTRPPPATSPAPLAPAATSTLAATAAPTASLRAATLTPAATDTAAATDTPAATDTLTATDTPAPSRTPARVLITYQDFEILPAVSTIKAGTPVTFLIKAGPFTFHQPYNFTAPNIFEAPANLGDGAAFTFTFGEPGAVTLLCGYHADMRATLVVEP